MTKFILNIDPGSEEIVLNKGDNLTYVLFANAGWGDVVRLHFTINGGNLNFYSFIIGRNAEMFPIELIAKHKAPESKSHFYCKAALFDDSRVDCGANLIVEESAKQTDTYLAHNTLLLSNKAGAKAIPSMEIMTDDVRAGHAATMGKVDKELLFYLKSRGIDEKMAKNLIITGFFEGQIQMIPDEDIRYRLREMLTESLPFSTELITAK